MMSYLRQILEYCLEHNIYIYADNGGDDLFDFDYGAILKFVIMYIVFKSEWISMPFHP